MSSAPGVPRAVDACAVLGRTAARLSDGAPLAGVLADAVAEVGLRSAVLRDGRGDLLAVAGDVVHAVPADRAEPGLAAVVELPVPSATAPVAALTVVGARSGDLPVLRALAAVLGLALAAPPADRLPLALLEAADADSDAVADGLHDGPVQDLVAARLVADAAVRGGDAVVVRDAVQVALQSLRRALWFLRPRGADDGGLGPALEQLSSRLAEAGRPPLLLDADAAACAALPPHGSSVAYRLVQALAAGPGEPSTQVGVHRAGTGVEVRVDGGRALPAPDRWAARARAVGGVLTSTSRTAVLAVPCDQDGPAPATPTPTTPARRPT